MIISTGNDFDGAGLIAAIRLVVEKGEQYPDEFEVLANRTGNLVDLLRQADYDMAEFCRLFARELFNIKPFDYYAVAGYPYGKSVRGWKKWRRNNGHHESSRLRKA